MESLQVVCAAGCSTETMVDYDLIVLGLVVLGLVAVIALPALAQPWVTTRKQ